MDVISYALNKKIAEHAVSGVQSMSVDGQTLTINTKDSGVLTMTFPTPKDGVSVADIDVNANNQIVFTMSDGSEFISGKIPTVKGADGYTPQKGVDYFDGADGVSPIVTVTKEGKIATITCTDVNGTTTATIKDGENSEGGEANIIESISVNGTPISVDENKNADITVPSIEGLTKDADLATIAKSGDYEDLINKPIIPSLNGYATETWVNEQGYLTEHQDLSAYATKDEIPTVPSKVSELTNDSNYQTAEQVNSAVTKEIAKVVADAPEDFDTLKEMSDWIAGHVDDASAMNSAISDNKTAITALQTGKADKSEIPTTLPANGGNADTVNNHTIESDVPTNAVFTDTIYDDTEVKESIEELSSNLDSKMNASNPTGTGSFSLNRKASTTIGTNSFSEGNNTTATGYASHAEGDGTVATSYASHAEGFSTTASGNHGSHAEGHLSKATGLSSHAEGYSSNATGSASHAEGSYTIASGNSGSHAEGYYTKAQYQFQHVQGKYNDNKEVNAFEVGNGTGESSRSNAMELTWEGDLTVAGYITDGYGNSLKMVADEVNQQNAEKKNLIDYMDNSLFTNNNYTTRKYNQDVIEVNTGSTSNCGIYIDQNKIYTILNAAEAKNKKVTFSAYVRTISSNPIDIKFGFGYENIEEISSEWKRLSHTIDFVGNRTGHIVIYTNVGVSTKIEVKNVQLEVGELSDYVPYCPTNAELKNAVDELKNNVDILEFGEIAGSKNLANINDFKVLTSNPSRYGYEWLSMKGGTYTFNITNGNNTLYIGYKHNGEFVNPNSVKNGSKVQTITISNGDDIVIWYDEGVTENTLTKLQLEVGSVASTYEPYIPSVKMLAEEVNQQKNDLGVKSVYIPSNDAFGTVSDNASYVYGKLCVLSFKFTTSSSCTKHSPIVPNGIKYFSDTGEVLKPLGKSFLTTNKYNNGFYVYTNGNIYVGDDDIPNGTTLYITGSFMIE